MKTHPVCLPQVTAILFLALSLLGTGCDAAQQNSVLDALSNSTTTLLDALVDAAIQALKQDHSAPVTTV